MKFPYVPVDPATPAPDGVSASVPLPSQAAGGAGADTPRTVIRGETPSTEDNEGPAFVTLTDYLSVTFPLTADSTPETVFRLLTDATQARFGGMADRGRGLNGYLRSFTFDVGGVIYAYGGQRGTGFLSLPGKACALVPDWAVLHELIRDRLQARITRWDGAVDDFYGVHTVDEAVALYQAGAFTSRGRKPSYRTEGPWLTPTGEGRTFYVGRRENGKLFRAYEKGKQAGNPDSPWVRWEVEFHNRDRVIPHDVLLYPARYIAGAYPALSWVTPGGARIETVKRQDAISYKRLSECAAVSYGRHINVMLQREGSAERVVEILRRDGVPERLDLSERLGARGDSLE